MTDPIHWSDLRWPEIDALDRDTTIIVQPTGAIEQHGLHLPVDTDIHNPLRMAEALSRGAIDTGARHRVVVAPPIWWGVSPHHMGYPGTLSLRSEVMADVVVDICSSLVQHGFYRVLVLNGHGGNDGTLSAASLRLAEEVGLSIAVTSYWKLVRQTLREVGESVRGGMGHGGEMETSLQMYFRGDRVDGTALTEQLPQQWSEATRIDFRDPGSVHFPWNFVQDTKTGAMGDPSLATPDKGEAIAGAVQAALGEFVAEFAAVPKGRVLGPPLRPSR